MTGTNESLLGSEDHLSSKVKKGTRFLKTEFLPYAWSTKLENHTSWKAERKVSFPQGRSLVTHEWNQKEIQLFDRKASFRKTKFVNKRVGMAGWMHPQFCYEWLGKAISLLFRLSASSSLWIMAALLVLLAVTNACKRTVRFWVPRCLRCVNADGQTHFLWREQRKGRNRLASHILTWERALNHPRDVMVSHLLGWGHWWDTSQEMSCNTQCVASPGARPPSCVGADTPVSLESYTFSCDFFVCFFNFGPE